ncbi:MAG: VIT1/CCC1 transporter family protein [Chloroflexota bacterium]
MRMRVDLAGEPVAAGAAAVASIRDVILGGQDGLVNVLGLVLGLAVATGDSRVIVTAALASMFAESIAMAGVAYTSRGAERDFATGMRARLAAELRAASIERLADLRARLAANGRGVDEIETALAAAETESRAWQAGFERLDRAMAPVREAHPGRAAVVVGLSTIAGSAVPLTPFLLLPVTVAPAAAVVAAAVVLFVAGVERARLTGAPALRAGLEMVGIGLLSALAGYLIGRGLRSPAI